MVLEATIVTAVAASLVLLRVRGAGRLELTVYVLRYASFWSDLFGCAPAPRPRALAFVYLLTL